MVGFTLLSRSYYYLRTVDEVPAPRSRPTTVRQGNGGLDKPRFFGMHTGKPENATLKASMVQGFTLISRSY